MRINKLIICTAAMLLTLSNAFAQQLSKSDDRYEFQPRWYIQFQDGATYTAGEASKSAYLLSPIFQLGGGYEFNPYFGLRSNLGYGEYRAFAEGNGFKGEILQLQGDATLNLTNLLLGYRHNWAVNVYPFIGFVANLGVENQTGINYAPAPWEPVSFCPAGRAGVHFDLIITNHVSATLEGNYNITGDKLNSKIEGRPDKQFNVLAGLKYNMGKGFTASKAYLAAQAAAEEARIAAEKAAAERAAAEAEAARLAAEKAAAEKAAAEKVDTEAARKAAEEAAKAAAEAEHKANCVEHSCNIFFALDRSVIREMEMPKVDALAQWLNENPDYSTAICGYTDRGTGTPRYNLTLSERRVKAVKKALMERGIDESRLITDFKGDNVQPFELPEQNRVVMCIVQ